MKSKNKEKIDSKSRVDDSNLKIKKLSKKEYYKKMLKSGKELKKSNEKHTNKTSTNKKLEKSKKSKKQEKKIKSSDDYSSSSVVSDYDLLNERIVPLENYTSDPKLLLSEAIKCFKGNTFESLKPAILSDWNVEDIKDKFHSYLESMSEATIVKTMNRNKSDDESSSSEEEASLQKNHVDSTTSNFAPKTSQPPTAEDPSESNSPPQQQNNLEEEEDYFIEEEVVDEVTEFEKLELLLRQRAIKSLQKKKSAAK